MKHRKEMESLLKSLKSWRDERNLTVMGQRKGFTNNILEEIREFFVAIGKEDRELELDALCDVLVVVFNTVSEKENILDKVNYPIVEQTTYIQITGISRSPRALMSGITKMILESEFALEKILETRAETNREQAEELVEAIITQRAYSAYLATAHICELRGYDLSKAMEETLKQIHSRKGYFNAEINKFIKTTKPEEEYKANYQLAIKD